MMEDITEVEDMKTTVVLENVEVVGGLYPKVLVEDLEVVVVLEDLEVVVSEVVVPLVVGDLTSKVYYSFLHHKAACPLVQRLVLLK